LPYVPDYALSAGSLSNVWGTPHTDGNWNPATVQVWYNIYIKVNCQAMKNGYPGYTGGYAITVTDGIISSFTGDGSIITSAKVDSGNSGGLATTKDGSCFIGVPTAVIEGDYESIGFIIPVDQILDFIAEVGG
jgi:hypothetical protein